MWTRSGEDELRTPRIALAPRLGFCSSGLGPRRHLSTPEVPNVPNNVASTGLCMEASKGEDIHAQKKTMLGEALLQGGATGWERNQKRTTGKFFLLFPPLLVVPDPRNYLN